MESNKTPAITMIDSHCHLDLTPFALDVDAVIERAFEHGVTGIHIPGTTQTGWLRQAQLAQKHSAIDYSFGLHPYFLSENWKASLVALEKTLANDKSALALGEIGLDAVIDVSYDMQLAACERQLWLANELGLPVILHHRKTHHELLGLLKKVNFLNGGVVHAFSGGPDVAKRYIEKGFVLGIGGTITYPRANKTRKAIGAISLEHIVLETDAPDMPINGFQGQRNEPSRLHYVRDALAEIKGVSAFEVSNTTTQTYNRVFSKS